jgi:hypothetical protein
MLTTLYQWLTSTFPAITFCPVSAAESSTYPVVLYQLVKSTPTHNLDGTVAIYTAEVHLTIMSLLHSGVDTLANTITAGMEGYRGIMGTTGDGTPGLATMTLDQFATLTLDDFATLPLDGTTTGDGIGVIVKQLDESDTDVLYDPSEDAYVYQRSQEYEIRWKTLTTSD